MALGVERPARKRSVAICLLALVAAALAARIAAACWLDRQLGGRFAFGDSESYWSLARAIARGGPYQFGSADARVFRTPGYPFLLAPIFLIGGDQPPAIWGRTISAVCGAFGVLGVWWLGQRLFGERAGWIAGATAACDPTSVVTSALVLSEAPFGPLMLAHLALWVGAWQAPSLKRGAAIGLAAGTAAAAATLVRPSWLLFTPFAILVGLVFGQQRKRHLAVGLAILLGLCAVMAPWWIRNALVTGHFVPTTLQVGASLYDGLNPAATGASNMDFVKRFTEIERARFATSEGAEECFEYYLDKRFRQEAANWAVSHPGQALRLAGVKLLRLWNIWPNEPRYSSWPVRLAVAFGFVPVFVVGLSGAWKTIRWGWPYVLLWLPAAYFTLLHVIFVASIRYRQPAMLTLMVLAAGVVVSGRRRALRADGVGRR